MRRNRLASAAVAAVAITVPVTAVTGPVFMSTVFGSTVFVSTAQAATISGQQKAAPASAAKTPKRVLKKVTRQAPVTWNMVAAALAKRLVGDAYSYGGTSPAGFDCSGLTQFVYRHTGHGKAIQRTAEAQFLQFRRISHGTARPGDLVFFHDTSDPSSYVYHVGVYEGGDDMVAATTYGEGVQLQSFTWGGDTVTFGTMTH
jgi:cell wall-associated NlpC family hydrolase